MFLDAGELVWQVLDGLRHATHDEKDLSASTPAFVSRVLTAFEFESQHKLQAATARRSQPTRRSGMLIETLTAREAEVLRMLVSGDSNQEIASKLVISLATVKKHVGNIFGKLGVKNRVQAITLVRDWPDIG